MSNKSGNAYALTLLCPILPGAPPTAGPDGESYVASLRFQLQKLSDHKQMSLVPNTYLSRCWVLDDVPYQGDPASLEHLKSKYLVFSANFYGELDDYLKGMWNAVKPAIQFVLSHCVGFSGVNDEASFIAYIKKCQVKTTFFFNGSTDDPLAEQLKALYLKQELTKFAYENQGKTPANLQAAFREFVLRVQPENTARPTWKPGVCGLESVVAP